MRKQGERIISNRVRLPVDSTEKLLLHIKQEHCWTWKQFAAYLGVAEHTLAHDWRHARITLPEPIFEKLKRLSDHNEIFASEILPPCWGQKLGGIHCQQSKVPRGRLPSPNTVAFAEFYGAMLGDGCVYGNQRSICITSNAVQDKWYVAQYLASLCYDLFALRPRIYFSRREKAVRLVLNGRKIAEFFLQQGFPAGKKNTRLLEIPKPFFNDKNLLAACLRGFVDTDGGVHPHPHTKIMLGVTSNSSSLIASLHQAFQVLGVPIGKSRNCLQMYGRDKLARFFSIIGSSNPRNIIRYDQFLHQNVVPSAQETERLLTNPKLQFFVPYTGLVV